MCDDVSRGLFLVLDHKSCNMIVSYLFARGECCFAAWGTDCVEYSTSSRHAGSNAEVETGTRKVDTGRIVAIWGSGLPTQNSTR